VNPLVGDKAPSFALEGVCNKEFKSYTLPHEDGRWTILIFYPLDFTFVCPTEIIAFSDAAAKFRKLRAELYGISVDSKFSHLAWTETPRDRGGVGEIAYPLLADLNKEVATMFGVLTAAGVALRGLFIIDDDGVVQHATINNLSVGRKVDETLRLLQAYQYTKSHAGEVCPAEWEPGKETMKSNPSGLKDYARKVHA
jgi:peroxiredoxin (alkyl hydroperoxide reductase subunit C)